LSRSSVSVIFLMTALWTISSAAAESPSVSGELPSAAAGAPASKSDSAIATASSQQLSALAWGNLAAQLHHKRASHRANAVAALATIGSRRDVLPLLLGALRDKDSSVRKDAVVALGDLKVESAKPQLRKMLDDNSSEVGFTAASVLTKMGDHSGRDIFIATLQGERKGDGFIKQSVKTNAAKYRDPKVVAMIGAKEAAGALFGPFSIGLVVAAELMKDRSAAARAESATMLAQDASPEAVDELKLALCDKNWAVRAAAAQALAKSPGSVSVQDFEELLSDKNDSVRTIAAAGIIRRSGAGRPRSLNWPIASASVTVLASAQ
jgi:HEAT repeat protein